MEAQDKLNGSFTSKGNYVWGGALTLAWKQLSKNIIKQEIELQTKNWQLLTMVQNFNKSQFNSQMLSDSCYYAQAGFGNETVHKINSEVSKKFPGKTTEKLQPNLDPNSIISFAYFLKQMKFEYIFRSCSVEFNGKNVPGFQAEGFDQKKQILVHNYFNSKNFIIELKTTTLNDHIILMKNQNQLTPSQVLEIVNQYTSKSKSKGESIGSGDVFRMPKISLSRKRELKQLVGKQLKNQGFSQYAFSKIYEIIKLEIDEKGVKVENQADIYCVKGASKTKYYELNQPFWIVMRENFNHPYFIAYIKDVNDKDI